MLDSSRDPHWLLRRGDQATLAALVAVALVATFGWWIANGGWSGRLVEIDRAERRDVRFEVDVNAADGPELMQLPGIGPKLSEAIIESRQDDGPFTSPEDLRRVRGIGKKVLERMRPYLRFGPGGSSSSGRSP
jgi:competence protein ComEA